FAHEMRPRLSGFARNHLYRGFQILGAARDIGIAAGASRFPVIFMVHSPDIEAPAREHIHHRIFAMAWRIEVENPPRLRGAVHKEKNRPRRFARFWRAEPLTEYIEWNVALFGPVFSAPDVAVGRGMRRCRYAGEQARAEAQSGRLENRATRQNSVG